MKLPLLPLRYVRYHASNEISYGSHAYNTNERDFCIMLTPSWAVSGDGVEGRQWYARPLSHFAQHYPQAHQSYAQQWLHLVGFKRRSDVIAMLQAFLEGEGIECT